MKVTFYNRECDIVFHKYRNGRPCIELVETATGKPMAVATVNLPGEHLPDGAVFIKNYSENEGMVEALVAAGVIEPDPVCVVSSGFVQVPAHKLTAAALALRDV